MQASNKSEYGTDSRGRPIVAVVPARIWDAAAARNSFVRSVPRGATVQGGRLA